MKIQIQQSILSRHLDNAAKFLPKKDSIPILSHIVLSTTTEGLEIIAGNTETFIKSVISIDDITSHLTIERGGAIAIPGSKLTEIVKKLFGPVTIEVESGQVVIQAGNSEFGLTTLDPEEYPAFPDVNGTSITMKGKDLKELIATTSYAVSTQESTPILMGISFSQKNGLLILIGCDRHRLGRIETEIVGDDFQAVVNGSVLDELSKIMGDEDMEISFNNSMLIKTSEFSFWSRVIDGTYPETNKLIPNTFTTEITVSKNKLAAALGRVDIVAKESKTNLMKLAINQNEIMLESKGETKRAKESVEVIGFIGNVLTIGINGKYLSEAIKAIDSTEVEIGLNGLTSPVIIRGKEELSLHMVLPYRITEATS